MHETNVSAVTAPNRVNYQLLHEVPGRCRIRVARLRVDKAVRERISHRLSSSSLVSNFRLNPACDSITIEHMGKFDALLEMLLQPSTMLVTLPTGQLQTVPTKTIEFSPFRSMALATTALVLGPAGGFGLDLLLIVLTGFPIWRRAVTTLFKERRFNVDFLDGLALAIAVLRREPRTAAVIAMMVHLGDVVRELTARQSRGHMRELLDFQVVQARRLDDQGNITLIPAQSLQCDDLALMMAGDLVPADGMICSGLASVDQRHITGESVPATRRVGEMVFAG